MTQTFLLVHRPARRAKTLAPAAGKPSPAPGQDAETKVRRATLHLKSEADR